MVVLSIFVIAVLVIIFGYILVLFVSSLASVIRGISVIRQGRTYITEEEQKVNKRKLIISAIELFGATLAVISTILTFI